MNGTYSVNEDAGIVQPLLTLSNPSSFNETVEVRTSDFDAYGTYTGFCMYICIYAQLKF